MNACAQHDSNFEIISLKFINDEYSGCSNTLSNHDRWCWPRSRHVVEIYAPCCHEILCISMYAKQISTRWQSSHWKPIAFMGSTVSSLDAPQVVVMTTCGATTDEKVGFLPTLGFQYLCLFCIVWSVHIQTFVKLIGTFHNINVVAYNIFFANIPVENVNSTSAKTKK